MNAWIPLTNSFSSLGANRPGSGSAAEICSGLLAEEGDRRADEEGATLSFRKYIPEPGRPTVLVDRPDECMEYLKPGIPAESPMPVLLRFSRTPFPRLIDLR